MDVPQLKLTKCFVIILYVSYANFIVFCSSYVLYSIYSIDNCVSFFEIALVSLSSGAIGASACYIRKLYRDGMNNRFSIEDSVCSICIHTFVYYLFRPFFAAISSFFVIIAIKEGFFLLSASHNGQIDTIHFFYLSLFVSFLVGFNVAKMFNFFKREGGLL